MPIVMTFRIFLKSIRKLFRNVTLTVNYVAVLCLLLAYLSVYINPQDFWLFSFFGLLYPVLFLINLGFVVFWAVRKNRLFLISLITMLIGWYHFNNTFQFRLFQKEPVSPVNSFSFLSYNVRLFNFYEWNKTPETGVRILELLNNHNTDIICVQEYFYHPDNPLNEHPEYKKLHQRYSHIAYSNVRQGNRNLGNAIFSRYPIARSGTIRFKNSHNISIYSDIIINDDTIRVYNNHLQSIEISGNLNHLLEGYTETNQTFTGLRMILASIKNAFVKRSLQLQVLMEHIEKSPYPVIIAGDFNETPVSYTYRTLRKTLRDAFVNSGRGMGTTYITRIPYLRIDFILYDKSLESFHYRKIPVVFSDHFPMKSSFYFRE